MRRTSPPEACRLGLLKDGISDRLIDGWLLDWSVKLGWLGRLVTLAVARPSCVRRSAGFELSRICGFVLDFGIESGRSRDRGGGEGIVV